MRITNVLKYNLYYKFVKILSTGSLLMLVACSTASESFDSQATQGVGSKSISQVNAMIDKGQIEGIKGDNCQSASKIDQVSASKIDHPFAVFLP